MVSSIESVWKDNMKALAKSCEECPIVFLLFVLPMAIVCTLKTLMICLQELQEPEEKAQTLDSMDDGDFAMFVLKRQLKRSNLKLDMSDVIIDPNTGDMYCQKWVNNIPNQGTQDVETDALKLIRLELLKSRRFTLRGYIIKVDHPKSSEVDMLRANKTGKKLTPHVVQRITFGNELNKALKIAYRNLVLRRLKNTNETYLVFENEELSDLASELSKTYLNKVKIKLIN